MNIDFVLFWAVCIAVLYGTEKILGPKKASAVIMKIAALFFEIVFYLFKAVVTISAAAITFIQKSVGAFIPKPKKINSH